MEFLDLVPKFLKETLGQPKKIAFILFCLLIVQTWAFVQYKGIQEEREKIWEDARKSVEMQSNFLDSQRSMLSRSPSTQPETITRSSSDFTFIITVDTAYTRNFPHERDSLLQALGRLMWNWGQWGQQLRMSNANSAITDFRPVAITPIKLVDLARRREVEDRSIRYFSIIICVAVLQLPVLMLLVIKRRTKQGTTRPEA